MSCGQVITKSIDVVNDLEGCAGDGLVVGADGITVDLRGHSITGRLGADGCEGDCIGRYRIDTAGHDGLTIKNGAIGYFRRAVYMQDTTDSLLTSLETGQGPYQVERVGIVLLRSSGNLLSRVTDRGGDPGILFWQSSRNTIEDSFTDGSINMPG